MIEQVDIYVYVTDTTNCDNLPLCQNVVDWGSIITSELQAIKESIVYSVPFDSEDALQSKLNVKPGCVLFVDRVDERSLVKLNSDQVTEENIRLSLLKIDGGEINSDGDFEGVDGTTVGNDQVLNLIPGLGFDLVNFNFSIPAVFYLYASVASGILAAISENKSRRRILSITSVITGAVYARNS